MLNGLDLFSGIGGIGQALGPWVKTRAYCERERFAQAILLSRMARGELDAAPIWDDVTTLTGHALEIIGAAEIDIIFGGFPCQDISTAGAGAGLGEGTRSGLFREICRLAGELRPSYIFLENVSAITIRGGESVIAELTKIGYDIRWITLSAGDIGATHERSRWWCLAHSKKPGDRRDSGGIQHEDGGSKLKMLREPHGPSESVGKEMGNPEKIRQQRGRKNRIKIVSAQHGQGLPDGPSFVVERPPLPDDDSGWERYLELYPTLEPAICGSPTWLQSRTNRIGALGNSVDVVCAREAFKILMTGIV